MQAVPEQAPVPMNNVQILCGAAAVRLDVAGLPPRQQRCCYAVCTCATAEAEIKFACREAVNVLLILTALESHTLFLPSCYQCLALAVWRCRGMGHDVSLRPASTDLCRGCMQVAWHTKKSMSKRKLTCISVVQADCSSCSRGPRNDAIEETDVAHSAHSAQAGSFGRRLPAAGCLLRCRQVRWGRA